MPQSEDRVVDGILAKPFQQSKLFDAVARISGRDTAATGKFRIIGAQFNTELVSQIRGVRMLLVEDNEINQQVAQELLESFGITVVVAENGEEAITMLGQEHFDGVLMDMQMPVMDGVTATREIRKDPKFAKLPIIALTANVMVSEQNEFLSAGMNDHIGKPIDPDRLVAVLAKWVRPSRPAETPPIPQTVSIPAAETLPDLPGVNVAESVRRIGGKVAVYYALLDRFRVNERDIVARIRAALDANDMKTAERLAHTLRGSAGSLGAENVQNQASLVESKIKNEPSAGVEPLLAQLDLQLATFIASIDRAFEARRV
jgi:CheY-like chemotaxis protein/HPt (histidine-containing phosphotransfer) domain-containing protein